MSPLQTKFASANSLLAPYAVPHDGTLGRIHKEPEDQTRTPFQRDRDRIIHAVAFRRLQGKTQVFVAGEGDHYRTRLTHTMEVAQIARDIARRLGLNEDLTECIALAHDLGHPPFGHAGEAALDAWMREHDSSFEHNAQSLRIVTVLEEHSSRYLGLNLNREILEGLQKHHTPFDISPTTYHLPPTTYSLEAQVVNLADEIAYTCHDSDDGLRAGLFTIEDIASLPIAARALRKSARRGTSLRGALIHMLVEDLTLASEAILSKQKIRTLKDVYASSKPLISFSRSVQKELKELSAFLWKRMYLSPSVARANEEGKRVVRLLCSAYCKDPPPKILALMKKTESGFTEAIKDYVSGMTDRFALEQAHQ